MSQIVTRARVFTLMGLTRGSLRIDTYISGIPLRSPMSIFSKSPDLEKCASVTGL